MGNPNVNAFADRIRRKAIIYDVGGFRPANDPKASWFGQVSWSLPGEVWPEHSGKPMTPLAQINLTELPFRPPRLDDIAFLTIFASADQLPNDEPNGTGWCLRAYKTTDELAPLRAPSSSFCVRPFPMRPRVIDADYPIHDDLPETPPEEVGEYYDSFSNTSGLKLGGWPTLIQSEIFWAPWNRHPIAPEYVFQIDSTEKGNWCWGDSGVGYFGRGTVADHRDEWALSWQCH